jgi:predicted HTH domain antitoxin
MPVTIPDEVLREAGLNEREAIIEIACRLFDAGKLALWPAAKLAGQTRPEFEQELRQRKIAIYRPTLEDLSADLRSLNQLENQVQTSFPNRAFQLASEGAETEP